MQTVVEIGMYSVRAYSVEGDSVPWLSLVDLCDHLGLSCPSDAASRLPPESQKVIIVEKTGPGTNRAIVIEPAAAFRLILRGRTPQSLAMAETLYDSLRKNICLPTVEITPPPLALPRSKNNPNAPQVISGPNFIRLGDGQVRLHRVNTQPLLWLSFSGVREALGLGEVTIADLEWRNGWRDTREGQAISPLRAANWIAKSPGNNDAILHQFFGNQRGSEGLYASGILPHISFANPDFPSKVLGPKCDTVR